MDRELVACAGGPSPDGGAVALQGSPTTDWPRASADATRNGPRCYRDPNELAMSVKETFVKVPKNTCDILRDVGDPDILQVVGHRLPVSVRGNHFGGGRPTSAADIRNALS